MDQRMSAQLFPGSVVAPFAEEMEIHFSQGGRKGIGIFLGESRASRIAHAQPVLERVGRAGQNHFKESGAKVLHGESFPLFGKDFDGFRFWPEGAHPHAALARVCTQDGVRIRVAQREQARKMWFDVHASCPVVLEHRTGRESQKLFGWEANPRGAVLQFVAKFVEKFFQLQGFQENVKSFPFREQLRPGE